MNHAPLVTIIIPVYQHHAALGRALDSVFVQTYPRFKVIVVDDGSVPPIQIGNERVLLIHTPHGGAPWARNVGAQNARGDFLLFVDADAILDPSLLAKMVQAAQEHPDASFIYSGFSWGSRTMGLEPFDERTLKVHNYIATTSLIRRPHFPGFDESLARLQDWDLWLTMSARGRKGWGIPEVLCRFKTRGHITKGGVSYLKAVKRIRRKHHLLPWRGDYIIALKETVRMLLPF